MTLAAMGYRAATERALKIINPDGRGSLYHRIEALKGVLPPALIGALLGCQRKLASLHG